MLRHGSIDWFLIQLDGFDDSQSEVAFIRKTQRCANLKDACFHSDTHDDRVLTVEDSTFHKKTREDCLRTFI